MLVCVHTMIDLFLQRFVSHPRMVICDHDLTLIGSHLFDHLHVLCHFRSLVDARYSIEDFFFACDYWELTCHITSRMEQILSANIIL